MGPLALIAQQVGFDVSGSDKQDSQYIDYLRSKGISEITIEQSTKAITHRHEQKPIDWYVYSSAVAIEQPDNPELTFVQSHGIRASKRDELIRYITEEKNLRMIAIAGTHGKTTTTAMTIWLFRQLGIPVSYSVGAKIPFGDMGHYDPASTYFIYEADEFDRNFLTFTPVLSIITGIDWDHQDIYPTREDYNTAFRQFIEQSESVCIWNDDANKLNISPSEKTAVLQKTDYPLSALPGRVNRENANIVAQAVMQLLEKDTFLEIIEILDLFPGVSRRFEKITENIYSDYAHTPPKIRGALQIAQETATQKVVVVYEGLHNTRQHFIKDELAYLFYGIKKLYIVPSYRAREDQTLENLTPDKLRDMLEGPADIEPSALDQTLLDNIKTHAEAGDVVLCLSAGGGGSLDEWLRQQFKKQPV
ncbi:UDP-N-acetylmuramate--L-alanine ligase [soil metagenome]